MTNIICGDIIGNAGLDLLIELNISKYGFYYVVCSRSKHFALSSNKILCVVASVTAADADESFYLHVLKQNSLL